MFADVSILNLPFLGYREAWRMTLFVSINGFLFKLIGRCGSFVIFLNSSFLVIMTKVHA